MSVERTTETESPLQWLAQLFRRTRQNHAVEHATVHILAQRYPGLEVMGRSTPAGFYIYGAVPTEVLVSAVTEALARLRAGESHLAIHPRCGTNLAVSSLVGGLVTSLFLRRRRAPWWEEFPQLLLALSDALLFSQPLAYNVQKHITTDANIGALHIRRVERRLLGGKMPVHYIELGSGGP
ncbi:MAG: DUF6391 domain-containing protein [Anaerolineae bacterium]